MAARPLAPRRAGGDLGLGLLVAVPGAAAVGAAAAVGGGALAICVGSKPPVWRSRRLLVALSVGACALSGAAGALAPAAHVRRAAPAPVGAAPVAALPHAAAAAPASRAAASRARVTAAPATRSHAPATASPGPSRSTSAAAATSASPAAAATPSASRAHAATPSASPALAATPTPAAASQPVAGPPPTTDAAVAPPSQQAVAAATKLVRTYYAALDAHHFAVAWATLPPAIHTSFGSFAHWRAGYRTTLTSRPGQIRVTATADGGLLVRNVLVATDRVRCGTRTQRFGVRWRLAPRRASWGVVSLAASALGPAERACL